MIGSMQYMLNAYGELFSHESAVSRTVHGLSGTAVYAASQKLPHATLQLHIALNSTILQYYVDSTTLMADG